MPFSTFWQDLRYAFRTLRKSPGFTAVAVVTLALGIGANTAIFSVVSAVLLRPLPFEDPGSLYLLTERFQGAPAAGPSWQNFEDWKAQSRSFSSVAAARNTLATLSGAGEPERLQEQMASASLFPLLGISAIAGHTFSPAEDRAGGPPVVLLSYGFWQSHFAGAPNAIGKSLTLDDQPYTIVGILPPGFQLVRPADVFLPLAPWAKTLPDDRSWHPGIIAIGRLNRGAKLDSARAEMSTIAKRLELQYPVYDTDVGAMVTPLHEQLVQNIRPALLVLLGAVGLVLLIACANVANLLLARGNVRRREIAVRTAIGAGRSRIVRQLLTESIVLALAGGAAGVALAAAGIWPLVKLAGTTIPNVGPIALDQRVLLFTLTVVMLAGVLFGLAPALQTAKLDLRGALNDASRGSTGGAGQRRTRSILVSGEIALALVLLVGAGLLLRSFEQLQDVQPGFRPDNLLVADVPISPKIYSKSAERMAYFDNLLDRVRVLPGVKSAGAATYLPVSGGGPLIHFNIQGRAPKSARDYIVIGYRPVSAGYLDSLGVPLIRGRLPLPSDTERSPFVAVVNQAMERRFFPGESAMGKHVQLGGLPNKQVPYMEIVGIVGDMKQNLATDFAAEMYVPSRQADSMLPVFGLSLVLKTAQDPRSSISTLRRAVREINPNQPLVRIRTMRENIATSVSEPRFRTTLLAIFGLSALVLAVIGLYGLMAYTTSQRVQEIGIRLTLGAGPRQILGLVLRQGLTLALTGVVAGLAAALVLSRVLTGFLYGVTAADPATYVGVSALLVLVALFACYIPARRAMKVDPMSALRHE